MTESRLVTEPFERPTPHSGPRTTSYWTSGADGKLRVLRCQECGWYVHPPLPVCPVCRSRTLRFVPVSGCGVVHSWTLNHYSWSPQIPPPYVLASIELVEQPELRITSSVLGCGPSEMRIGMAVEACFARSGDAFIPLFQAS